MIVRAPPHHPPTHPGPGPHRRRPRRAVLAGAQRFVRPGRPRLGLTPSLIVATNPPAHLDRINNAKRQDCGGTGTGGIARPERGTDRQGREAGSRSHNESTKTRPELGHLRRALGRCCDVVTGYVIYKKTTRTPRGADNRQSPVQGQNRTEPSTEALSRRGWPRQQHGPPGQAAGATPRAGRGEEGWVGAGERQAATRTYAHTQSGHVG